MRLVDSWRISEDACATGSAIEEVFAICGCRLIAFPVLVNEAVVELVFSLVERCEDHPPPRDRELRAAIADVTMRIAMTPGDAEITIAATLASVAETVAKV